MTPPVNKPTDDVLDVGDPPGTDIDVRSDAYVARVEELKVSSPALREFLATTSVVETEDTETTALEIMARILDAETVADVLSPKKPVALQSLYGAVLSVRSVRWHKSGFAEGVGVYALLDVTDVATGETCLATCGGANVLAQLFALDRMDALPVTVKLVRSDKATANGYFPLWLEAVEADF